jgi:hypothetical protein
LGYSQVSLRDDDEIMVALPVAERSELGLGQGVLVSCGIRAFGRCSAQGRAPSWAVCRADFAVVFLKMVTIICRGRDGVMRGAAILIIGGCALALLGCHRARSLTPADFAFVTTNTTMSELMQKLRPPDEADFGAQTNYLYEWNLESRDVENNYLMRASVKALPFEATNWNMYMPTSKIQSVEVVRRPRFIDFSTSHSAQPH